MCRDIKRYEDTPAEEIADIELVGDEDDSPPGTYVWFNPTFKYLGTVMSWDLREAKYGNAPIKSINELVSSAKATFCSNPVCDCVLMCLDCRPARDGTHTTYQSRQTIPSLHKPLIVLVLNGSSSAGVKKVPTVGTDLYLFRYIDLHQLPTGRYRYVH